MRNLYKGCRGTDVINLQHRLSITPDGSFGPQTDRAVKDYQRANGLTVDGSVGPITQKALGLTDSDTNVGGRFRVDIYNKNQVWFAGTPYGSKAYPLKTVKQWAKEEKADVTYNLAFFNMTGSGTDQYGAIRGRTLTYLKGKGRDIGYGGVAERVVIDSQNICGGYKVGIKNGARKLVSSTGKRARNANGLLKDGRYFHVQSIGKETEYALVQHMANYYNVDLLLIQDAGGSVSKYDSKIDTLYTPEGVRSVASVVCVRR